MDKQQQPLDMSSTTVSQVQGAWLLVAKGDLYRKYGQGGAVVTDKADKRSHNSLYFFGGCSDDGLFSRDLVCHEFDGHAGEYPLTRKRAEAHLFFFSLSVLFLARIVEDTTPLEERPFARHFHSCVFYGGFFYVFGGKSNGYHNDLWQYHVYQNNWKMVKPISGQSKLFARFGQSAVLWQGALYVFGGYDQHGFCCDGLHAFQFARNAWFKELKTTGKARERYHHTAVVYGRCMYIFGGRSDNEALEDLLEYHFDARSWSIITTTGSPPSKRWGHSAAVVGDRMFVFGGCDGTSCFGDLHEYDFGTRRWALVDVPHCPSPRYFHMMTVEGDKMYVVGGKDLWGRCLASDHQILTSEGFLELRHLAQFWDGTGFIRGLTFATFNQRSSALEYQPASKLILNPPKKQTMVEFVSRDGSAVLQVTPDHDMFVECDDGKWQKVKAKELLACDDFVMRVASTNPDGNFSSSTGMDKEAATVALYGWWLGFSYCRADSRNCAQWLQERVCISECASLETLESEFATWDWWRLRAQLSSRRRLVSAFFTGAAQRGGVATRSTCIAKMIFSLAEENGYRAQSVARIDGSLHISVARGSVLRFRRGRLMLYCGLTWCVTVPNGLIVVRKGGGESAPVITGNCFDEVHEFRQRGASSAPVLVMQPLMGTPTPDATKVRLKLHFDDEIRVLVVNKSLAFDDLLGKLREQYDKAILFRYVDEESDMITVRSEDDWQEALLFYIRTGLQTFKVFLGEGQSLHKSNSRSGSMRAAHSSSRNSLMMTPSPRGHDSDGISSGAMAAVARSSSPALSPAESLVSGDGTLAGKEIAMRWQLGEKIGSGAFGQVYKVLNAETGELLAMKQVKITHETGGYKQVRKAVESLMQEIELMQGLSHPNIVRYLGSERRDDTLNIFMEFVPGGSIAGMLQKFSAFPEKVVGSFTKQILEGLKYLHERRIIHRDLKGEGIGI